MGMIYITDETRARLDILTEKESRAIVDEVGFLVDNRFKELGLPDDVKPSSVCNGNDNKNGQQSQENSQKGA